MGCLRGKPKAKKKYFQKSLDAFSNYVILFVLREYSSRNKANINNNNMLTLEQLNAINIAPEAYASARDLNTILTSTGTVSPVFMAHHFDPTTGKNGIKNLILDILTARGAVFQNDLDRESIIQKGLFTSQIMAECQARFSAGSTRYPLQTIKSYLSVFMRRESSIGFIKLTRSEDVSRKGTKCRYVWFAKQIQA